MNRLIIEQRSKFADSRKDSHLAWQHKERFPEFEEWSKSWQDHVAIIVDEEMPELCPMHGLLCLVAQAD